MVFVLELTTANLLTIASIVSLYSGGCLAQQIEWVRVDREVVSLAAASKDRIATARLAGNDGLAPRRLALYRRATTTADKNEEQTEPIGELKDDGAGPDERAGDGVFSLRFRLPDSEPSVVAIAVQAENADGSVAAEKIGPDLYVWADQTCAQAVAELAETLETKTADEVGERFFLKPSDYEVLRGLESRSEVKQAFVSALRSAEVQQSEEARCVVVTSQRIAPQYSAQLVMNLSRWQFGYWRVTAW